MPGYTRTRKLSIDKESEIKYRIMDVLDNSEEALTIDDIKKQDFTLEGLSSQKMARLLGGLIEMGLARKSRSNSLGRMVYKSTSVMREQGYDVDDDEEDEEEEYTGNARPHYVYRNGQWVIDKYITLE